MRCVFPGLLAVLALAAACGTACGGGHARFLPDPEDAAPDVAPEAEPPSTWLWHVGSESDRRYGNAAVEMDDGGVALVGFQSSGPLGDGDGWVVRLGPGGEVVWDLVVGGPGHEWPGAAAPHPDGGLVLAGGSSSLSTTPSAGLVWLVHLDAHGRPVWQRTFEGVTPFSASVLVPAGPDGLLLVVPASFEDHDGVRMWVARLDDAGEPIWQRRLVGLRADEVAAAPLRDGGFALAVTASGTTPGPSWVGRLRGDGELLWQRLLSTASDTMSPRVGVGEMQGGDLVLAVESQVFRLGPAGELRWQRRLVGDRELSAANVVAGPGDGAVVVGTEGGSPGGSSPDLWLLALDAHGEILWQRTAPREECQWAHDAILTRDGAVLALGGGCRDSLVLKIGLDAYFEGDCPYLHWAFATAVEADVAVEPHEAGWEEVSYQASETAPRLADSSTRVEVLCGG